LDFFLERTKLFTSCCPSICATKPCSRKPISQCLGKAPHPANRYSRSKS
jgi:hypothetical protein